MQPNPSLIFMETHSSNVPITTKKLCNKAKIALYMLRKTLAKTKLLVDLHINLKDGKLARKALANLVLQHHYAATTCGCTSSNTDTVFISPQKHTLKGSSTSKGKSHQLYANDKSEQVVIETWSEEAVSHELSRNESLMLDDHEESEVDKAAEDFIKRFYKQLKQQHITCVESPSPNRLWAQ